MQWESVISGVLSSSPLAGILGFAVWKLWTKLEAMEARVTALQEQRLADLKSLLKPST